MGLLIKNISNDLTINNPLYKAVLICFVLSSVLVGSCKTSELSDNKNNKYSLMPEVRSNKYTPAKGYSHTARKFISKNPDALLHMTEMQVKYLLGSPQIKWQESPAEIWQYRSDECTLDIYFYDNKTTNTPPTLRAEKKLQNHRKVSYYELRQLDKPDWSVAKSDSVDYLPSKIRTSGKISKCIKNITSHG